MLDISCVLCAPPPRGCCRGCRPQPRHRPSTGPDRRTTAPQRPGAAGARTPPAHTPAAIDERPTAAAADKSGACAALTSMLSSGTPAAALEALCYARGTTCTSSHEAGEWLPTSLLHPRNALSCSRTLFLRPLLAGAVPKLSLRSACTSSSRTGAAGLARRFRDVVFDFAALSPYTSMDSRASDLCAARCASSDWTSCHSP